MKKLFKVMSVLLVFVMLFSLASCTGNTDSKDTGTSNQGDVNTPNGDGDKFADIAGEYFLDGTDLGMPLKWYIKITADGTFKISTARDFSVDKGNGEVGAKDGTYMFMYSDSTNEKPKTATFKLENKDLVFSTSVPVGGASVSPTDDGIYPKAVLIAHEELLGSYFGSYEKTSAMAGSVLYEYKLTLTYGSKYIFSSSFEMMGSTYTRVETGTFAVADKEISFTALDVDGKKVENPAAVKGTLGDKSIKAPFKLSMMASEAQEVEAKFGTYAEYEGTYVTYYSSMMISRGVALVLDAFGNYEYATAGGDDGSEVDYTDVGTYTVTDGKIMLKSNTEGATAVEAKLSNYVITVKLPVTTMVPNTPELSLYAEEASGLFAAEAKAENGTTYGAALNLIGNSFELAVAKDDGAICYVASGTFEIKAGMVTQLSFTTTKLYKDAEMTTEVTNIPPELKNFDTPVSESGINAELVFDIDDTATLVFELVH